MIAYIRGIRRHQKSDEGASAVEYGLLVAAIAAVIVVVVFALGGLVKDKFNSTCNGIKSNGVSTSTNDCNGPAATSTP
jgi:pilus assembly protein Flp/PilA